MIDEISIANLTRPMLACEQTKGQTVHQHGQSVCQHFKMLVDGKLDPEHWRVPDWWKQYKICILANLHPDEVWLRYTVFHDCGKPFCRIVDEDGKVHFPDHANVSADVYLQHTRDEVVANLIRWDMVLHTATADDVQWYLEHEWTLQDAMTLLVAALAEIHSNAKMFGGISSNNFKAKWKKVSKRGKQICRHHFG